MQSEVALNVQQSIRPGECFDSFYSGKENSEKQCHATVEDNRFFASVGNGTVSSGASNTVTFNPQQGLGEVIVTFTLNGTDISGNNVALPTGWGYNLIRRIGYRYGSSQLYYISGAQNLIQALSLCEDSGKRDQLYALGGQSILNVGDTQNPAKWSAYVYLRLPHSSPALAGGALPFPTDLITAPVQIQLDMVDFASVISAGAGATAITSVQAVMNFSQVTMDNAGDLLARRFDMSKHALAVPLPECWTQEALGFPLSTGPDGSFQISLTGCKAGDLKGLRIYVVDALDTATATARNPNLFVGPSQVTFAINGLIYFDSRNGSWRLTDLLRRRTAPSISYSQLSGATAPWTATATASEWCEIQLAQPHAVGDTGETVLVHGVPVMNSVLSLQGVMPKTSYGGYVLYAEYDLNCSWLVTRGSADFVF
jgi:hypothetical protein